MTLSKQQTSCFLFTKPRTRQLLRREITYASVKEEEVNILHQLSYYDKQTSFFAHLNHHQGWIKNIVAHHLNLNSTDTCHVPNIENWLHGSFNVCIPVTVSTRSMKVILRLPLPYKVGEDFMPSNGDEKVRCEAGTYAWLQGNCLDVDPSEVFSNPQSGVLVWPDHEPEGIFDLDVTGHSLDDGPLHDWRSLDNFNHLFPNGTYLNWPQYTDPFQYEPPEPQRPEQQDSQMLQDPKDSKETPLAEVPSSIYRERGFKDVSDWLGGAYCPPFPCSYCHQHRLQCLILRTTSANPNPVTSCSSCVALFRECSLALGEKRQPSGFETLSPVLGHLHGVTEHMENGVSTVLVR